MSPLSALRKKAAWVRRNTSIRVQVLGWTGLLWAVVATGCLCWWLPELVREEQRTARDHVRAILEPLAVATARSIATRDFEALDGPFEELLAISSVDPPIRYLAAYNTHGEMITCAHSQKSPANACQHRIPRSFMERGLDLSSGTWMQYRDAEGGLRLAMTLPAHSGMRWGTVAAVFDLSPLQARGRLLVLRLLGYMGLILLVALIIVYYGLSRHFVAPIRALVDTAERIRQGDLGARFRHLGAAELNQLSDAFNRMAAALESGRADLTARVRARTLELSEANSRLQLEARTDGLTNLYNRRHFDEIFERECIRCLRNGRPLCALMLDVDNFKAYNDKWGHQAGDQVLATVGAFLRGRLRRSDIAARYGGEEFVVILVETSSRAGTRVAEAIRKEVRTLVVKDEDDSLLPPVTFSVGVAAWPEHGEDPSDVVRAADQALLLAKKRGRDRVERASGD